jgi:integrase
VRTRNARLAAIRSFFRFAALHLPDRLNQVQRILAIPQKKPDRRLVGFLTRSEIETLLAMPDRTTWIGRRDATLLVVALHTGLRVSELIGLRGGDVVLTAGAHVRCLGKEVQRPEA